MSDSKEFHIQFIKWLNDLGINNAITSSSKLPHEFSQLLQAVKLKKMWKYLMDNIKNKETALLVTQNLLLQRLKHRNDDDEQASVEMEGELKQTNADIRRLEERIEQKKSSCFKSELASSELQDTISLQRAWSLLHEVYMQDIHQKTDNISLFQAYFNRIHKELLLCNNAESKNTEQMFSCSAEVKEAASMTYKLYRGGFDRENLEKSDSWKKSLKILSSYPAKTVVDCLVSLTNKETKKLALCSDSEDTNQQSRSLSPDLTPTETVQRMMERHHKTSLIELQEALRNEATAAEADKSIHQLTVEIQNQLSGIPQAESTRELFDIEVQLVGQQAYLESLRSSVQLLQRELDSDALLEQEMSRKQQEVKDFNRELARCQQEIIHTTRQNSDFRENLPNYQKENIELAHATVCDKQDPVTHLCSMLQNALKDEFVALNSSDVSKLLTVNVGRKPIPIYSLSIHRPLKNCYESGGLAYLQTCQMLGTHFLKAPSALLLDVVNTKHACDFHESASKTTERFVKQAATKSEQLEETTKQVESVKQECHQKMCDRIAQGMKCMANLQDEALKLEGSLTDWCDEPAQNAAVWLRVDGMDLGKWKQAQMT